MLLRYALGEVLRRRRLLLGKTLRDVAAESRVSLPYLSEIERGRKEPSSEILAAVCGVLRLDLSALLVDAVGLLDQTAHDRLGAASVAPVLDLTARRAGDLGRQDHRSAATLGDATSLVMLAA
jgi:transcriptional regulator with XRE-family HTH domain